MSTQSLIITLDGPAGSGKSTMAKELARRFDIPFLETGAMYRALAWIAIEESLDPCNGEMLINRAKELCMAVDLTSAVPLLLVNKVALKDELRTPEVTRVVSPVSAQPAVREFLVDLQRETASKHPRLVTEGRDQGSVVFPNATVRFYLTASVEERAKRRFLEMESNGELEEISVVRESIQQRDEFDRNRKIGPLVCPQGATVIQTDGVSKADVVEWLIREVHKVLKDEPITCD